MKEMKHKSKEGKKKERRLVEEKKVGCDSWQLILCQILFIDVYEIYMILNVGNNF